MKIVLDKEKLVSNPPQLGCVLFLPGLPGGGSKIYDKSPYGNSGTITGATWVRLPGGLWCLSFDGSDDYVDCGDKDSLKIAGDLTLEAWANLQATGTNPTITSNQDGGTSGYTLAITTGRKIAFRHNGLDTPAMTTDELVGTGQWYHLAGIYSGSEGKLKILINGKLRKQVNTSGTPAAATYSLKIGRYGASGAEYFNGRIALVRVYNRALSALQIQNHFYQEKHIFGVW